MRLNLFAQHPTVTGNCVWFSHSFTLWACIIKYKCIAASSRVFDPIFRSWSHFHSIILCVIFQVIRSTYPLSTLLCHHSISSYLLHSNTHTQTHTRISRYCTRTHKAYIKNYCFFAVRTLLWRQLCIISRVFAMCLCILFSNIYRNFEYIEGKLYTTLYSLSLLLFLIFHTYIYIYISTLVHYIEDNQTQWYKAHFQ